MSRPPAKSSAAKGRSPERSAEKHPAVRFTVPPLEEHLKAAWILAGALWLLALLAIVLPPGFSWGLNHFRYLPLPATILLFTVPIVVAALIQRFGTNLGGVRLPAPVIAGGMAILFFALFSVLRAETWLLGDGMLCLRDITPRDFVIFYLPEPLESSLHSFVFQTFNMATTWDAYRWLPIFFGALFLTGLWFFARRSWPGHPESWLPTAALACSGAAMHYFGYVENYAVTSSLTFLFVLAGAVYISGRLAFPWVLAIYVTLVFAHYSTLAFLPWVLLLPILGREWRNWRTLPWNLLPLAWGALWLFWVKTGHTSSDPKGLSLDILIPVFGAADGYDMFSPRHLADWFNQQFLVAAPGILLVIYRMSLGNLREIFASRTGIFLLATTATGWGFQFMLDSTLGMPRDWDLYTWGSMPFLATAIFWTMESRRAGLRVLTPILAASAALLLGFVLVNHSETASVNRFESLLQSQPSRAAYGYEILAKWFGGKPDYNKEAEYWKKGLALKPENARYWLNLAICEQNRKNGDAMEAAMVQANKWYQGTNAGVSYNLANYYVQAGRQADALAALQPTLDKNPNTPELLRVASQLLFQAGRGDTSLVLARRLWELTPDDPNAIRTALDLSLMLRSDKELELIASAAARSSQPDLWRSAALAYDALGDGATALTLLKRYAQSPGAKVTPELTHQIAVLEKRPPAPLRKP